MKVKPQMDKNTLIYYEMNVVTQKHHQLLSYLRKDL